MAGPWEDYALPQSQTAPATSNAGPWSDFQSQPQAVTQTEQPNAVSRFASNLWDKSIGSMIPLLKRAVGTDELDKAYEAAKQGDYKSAGHALEDWAGGAKTLWNPLLAPGNRVATAVAQPAIQNVQTGIQEVKNAAQALKDGRYEDAVVHGATALFPTRTEQVQKAVDAVKAGHAPDAMAHIAAAVTGGDEAATMANSAEQMRSGDVAGGLGSAIAPVVNAGLAAAGGGAAPEMVEATGVPGALRAAGVPDALRESAEAQYARVLNATTKGNKIRSAEVVPQLIDRGVTAVTLKGLQKQAASQMANFGQQIGNAFERLPEGTAVPIDAMKKGIMDAAEDAYTVQGPDGQPQSMSEVADAGIKHAKDIVDRLDQLATVDPTTGAKTIPADTARRLRQYYDSIAQQAGRYDGAALADQSAAAAHAMAADAIRSQLASQFPDIAALNKEYSFWSDVNRVVSDTLTRRQGQAQPLGRQLMGAAGTGAGFVAGGVKGAILGREAMAALQTATSSPAWRTISAVLKDRLADAISNGRTATASLLANQISKAAVEGEKTVSATTPRQTATMGDVRDYAAAQGISEDAARKAATDAGYDIEEEPPQAATK